MLTNKMAALEEEKLTINEEYAKRYEQKKRAEELSKLKDKYGDVTLGEDEDSSSSSEEEEEDEVAEGITDENDMNFLRTLSLIKGRDKCIYKPKVAFYSSEGSDTGDQGEGEPELSQKEAPMFLKDYERKRLLERGTLALVSDSEEEEEEGEGLERKKKKAKSYVEEQEELKLSLKAAAGVTSDTGDEEELLTVRHRTKEETECEEKDYIRWLKGEENKISQQQAADMATLKRYWTDPNLSRDEAFLRDYLLNRGYLDMDAYRIPSYKDVVGEDTAEGGGANTDSIESGEGEGERQLVSSDEEEVERQEQFEREYNFRFEEPGGTDIVSFPRQVTGSVRREDDKRKQRRKERAERKEAEKDKKREELRRLKNLKRQEIKEKVQKIKALTGNPSVGFSEEDLEGDFDPEKYDATMQSAFNEDYYQEEEVVKPEFSDDDEDDDEQWSFYEESGDLHCEDPGFIMDADYIPVTKGDRRNQTALNKKEKRLHQKPLFDPEEKSFEDYFDEYYKLDFEDIIGGDILCRFKYREVMPNSYGLTTEEILSADDKDLNRWVSLKKAVRYSHETEEKVDLRKYKRKARDWRQKKRVLASVYQSEEHGETSESSSGVSGRKGKGGKLGHRKFDNGETANLHGQSRGSKGKEKSRSVSLGRVPPQDEDNGCLADSSLAAPNSGEGKKRKRKRVAESKTAAVGHISSKRLKAYGVTMGTAMKRKGKGKGFRDRKRTM